MLSHPVPHRPAAGVAELMVIIDGACGFCTACARFLEQRSSVPVTVVAWQQTDVAAYGLTRQQAAARVHAVIAGRTYGGHQAVARILVAQHRLLPRATGRAISTPPGSWLAAFGYHLIARSRHLLPGGTPACAAPQPEAQDF